MYRLKGGQTATGEVAVTPSGLRLQLFQQAGQGAATVADAAFLPPGQLGGAAVEFGGVEHRIVAKAAFTAGLGQDSAGPAAVADNRCGIVGVAQVHQYTVELGARSEEH